MDGKEVSNVTEYVNQKGTYTTMGYHGVVKIVYGKWRKVKTKKGYHLIIRTIILFTDDGGKHEINIFKPAIYD